MSMKNIDRIRSELTMVIHHVETLQRNTDAPHQCCRDVAPRRAGRRSASGHCRDRKRGALTSKA